MTSAPRIVRSTARSLLLLSACSLLSAAEQRPNVLLILVDDLKPLSGSYGDALARTPSIDRLAARGVQFDLAYCNQAVCAPSRFNLMLGSRSTSTGLYGLGNNLRQVLPDAVTLPQHFARHGYRTESLGKVFHVGHGNLGDPDSFGVPHFKDKVIEYALPESTGGKVTREEALFGNIKSDVPTKQLHRGAAWEAPVLPDETYADGRVARETVNRLRTAKARGTPFFLAVGFARPHLPFTVPKKYWDLYDPAKFQLARHTTLPTGAPTYAVKGIGELNQYDPIPDAPPVSPDLQRKLIHGYYASTSYMDAQLGVVLAELDRLGLATNTLVVLWGDNGFSFGTHGDWTKHTNYEESNHIPLIFAGPGIAAGARTRALIETVDIFPTLCALTGLPAPTGPQPIDGLSQLPVLRDPKTKVRDHAYHAFPRPRPGRGEWLGRAIRTERYRFVEWKSVRASTEPADLELYDYVADPGETTNVAAQQPEVVAKLRALLARHPAAKLPFAAKP